MANQSLCLAPVALVCVRWGRKVSGCDPIIAIDPINMKLDMAREFGATHTIDVSDKEAVSAIAEICPGGTDLAIEASGRPTVMATALSVVRDRGGRAVVIGNAPNGQTIVLDPMQFNLGKSLFGNMGRRFGAGSRFPALRLVDG